MGRSWAGGGQMSMVQLINYGRDDGDGSGGSM